MPQRRAPFRINVNDDVEPKVLQALVDPSTKQIIFPHLLKYGNIHSGRCFAGTDGGYGCGKSGHKLRYFPSPVGKVRDTDSETPTLKLISVFNEFLEVFLDDLTSFPPEMKIDFCIDLLPHTHPIYIHPYHLALTELKESNDQLKDLLDKGFIKSSISL
ncbi:hypothetical protein MTR67_040124 [Solanum verrucosum]|uniref:Uncharacterized protein n=1 Tax=Solanum verrucosum TaxID=315347 RepID=A0AAF0UK93_SOLVR|nr:hypothetical protein MTR67_040124 [Solanum verrucosum]